MFLRKRGLDADLCFGWNGPSWSLTMTVIALELVNCRLLDQCKISRVKLLTHEIKVRIIYARCWLLSSLKAGRYLALLLFRRVSGKLA